jgi:hypothetical protein
MKMVAYALATLTFLAAFPALAQNQTGTGSGLPRQPGDRERALAIRNGDVTPEQLGSVAYSGPYGGPTLVTPRTVVIVPANPALQSGAGSNCGLAGPSLDCQPPAVGTLGR